MEQKAKLHIFLYVKFVEMTADTYTSTTKKKIIRRLTENNLNTKCFFFQIKSC